MHSHRAAFWSLRRLTLGILALVLFGAGLSGAFSVSIAGSERSLGEKSRGRTADRFRVQVYATTDQDAAESMRSEVHRWWSSVEGQAPEGIFASDLPIVIEHAEPYYRVHVGAFSSRRQARRARQFLRRQYPGAFIVQRPAPAMVGGEADREISTEGQRSDPRFRVQLFATTDRRTAEGFRSGVRRWWSSVEGRAPNSVFGSNPRLTVEHDGAYYRVRMGAFVTREEARAGKAFLQQRYSDAFIVRAEPSGANRGATEPGNARPTEPEAGETRGRPTQQYDPLPSGRRGQSDSLEFDPAAVWERIREAANLVERLTRDSVYTRDNVAQIFRVGCSPIRPEQARASALDEEASHLDRNLGVDLEARYGQRTSPIVGEFAGGLSGTYVGLDWDLLDQGLLGNRQRSDLLEARARAERLTGQLAQIQRTETCRARRVQERFRQMVPRLLKRKIELAEHRKRLLHRAYLEGEALLDDVLQAEGSLKESRQRLATLRETVHEDAQPAPLTAFPPLLTLDFEALSRAPQGDSLRHRLGEVERRVLSLRDEAATETRLSVFGRYTTSRTFEDRDFEFGLRFSQPLFGALLGNDEVAEVQRAELRRRQERLALRNQQENLRTVHRRFEEDQARAVRAHYRTVSRRERVRRHLGEHTVRGAQRLSDALRDAERLLSAAIEKILAYGEVYEEVARAFGAAREPFQPGVLALHPVSSYEQRGRAGRRSLYIWSQGFQAHSNDFLVELARARKIERLIVSAGRGTSMDKLRALQARAHENDFDVELLLAPNHWVRPGGLERARARLEALDLQGAALHLDIEPHMFEDFEQREDELLRRYLELLRMVRRITGDNELVVSVPLFWPDYVYREIGKIVDRVHLMAYGEKEPHERAGEILEAARHLAPEQRVVALRPEDFANPWTLDQSIATLQKVVATDWFALHDLESFLQLISDEP